MPTSAPLLVIPSGLKPEQPASLHRFQTDRGEHALVVNGSRVFSFPSEVASMLDSTPAHLHESLLSRLGISAEPFIDAAPLASPPLRALSLAVAQKCNLGCTYCYAQEGGFGQKEQSMSTEVAFASVDLLFADAQPGDRVQLTFLGGEPLTNRDLIRHCTERAFALAETRRVTVSFSITTNGTLLTEADGEFFEQYGFAVTISLDGIGAAHDRLRMFKDGRGSYMRILDRVKPLLAGQRRMQVSARCTVTPENIQLRETLETFLALGFHSVGFSPMLSSPTGRAEMNASALRAMLAAMIDCGDEFERRVHAGERFGFANLYTALHEIHKGTHRPYPCGAGAGYMGVSAQGELSACHRFVEDPAGRMGHVSTGVDAASQNRWLAERHVQQQNPCRTCWARYLCGGGCHHEVIHRGRPACDYIRGWLDYSLKAYVRMLEARPEFFQA